MINVKYYILKNDAEWKWFIHYNSKDFSLLIYFSISCLFFIINYMLGQTNC